MTGTPCKVLILTADAGFGHRSAANAVAEALRIQYGSDVIVSIVNPLDDALAPPFLRDSQTDYDRWVKNVPELYKIGYEASDALIPTRMLERTLSLLLYEVMKETLTRFEPDVVLSTYPMYQSALTRFFRLHKIHVPFYTVITDLSTVHRLWFHKRVDGCLVPNQLVADLALSYEQPPKKICITGIPVHPDISREKRTANEIRKELSWQPDLTTLLAVGSSRVDQLMEMLNVVNHYGAPLQLAVVAGRNEELFNQLNQYTWHIPVHLYDFVEQMSPLQKASDLVICKAGGLIVTESLACGLPLILVEIIPGQEAGNAELVTTSGAGDMAETPIQMLEVLNHLLQDGQKLLKERARNALALGKPESAFSVAAILWKAAHRRTAPKSTRKNPLPAADRKPG